MNRDCYLCGVTLPVEQLMDLGNGTIDPDTGYVDEVLVCSACCSQLIEQGEEARFTADWPEVR